MNFYFYIFGYVMGSIPTGLLLTRLLGGKDLRKIGSGNIGATNVLRSGRKGAAALTLVLDMVKVMIPMYVAQQYAPDMLGMTGLLAVIGHIAPVWLKFKGGKGVASLFGFWAVAAPHVFLMMAISWLSTLLLFRYSSLSAIVTIVALPVLTFYHAGPFMREALFLSVLILWRHRGNIQRLIAGTETKVGEKSS